MRRGTQQGPLRVQNEPERFDPIGYAASTGTRRTPALALFGVTPNSRKSTPPTHCIYGTNPGFCRRRHKSNVNGGTGSFRPVAASRLEIADRGSVDSCYV